MQPHISLLELAIDAAETEGGADAATMTGAPGVTGVTGVTGSVASDGMSVISGAAASSSKPSKTREQGRVARLLVSSTSEESFEEVRARLPRYRFVSSSPPEPARREREQGGEGAGNLAPCTPVPLEPPAPPAPAPVPTALLSPPARPAGLRRAVSPTTAAHSATPEGHHVGETGGVVGGGGGGGGRDPGGRGVGYDAVYRELLEEKRTLTQGIEEMKLRALAMFGADHGRTPSLPPRTHGTCPSPPHSHIHWLGTGPARDAPAGGGGGED